MTDAINLANALTTLDARRAEIAVHIVDSLVTSGFASTEDTLPKKRRRRGRRA